jgi:hypothetical protein
MGDKMIVEHPGFNNNLLRKIELIDEPIPKQFLTTADKRLQKENRSNSTIFFPI